jgi:threonyl-tRNA synthetase
MCIRYSENYAGAMPPWLAPIQVAVCCISESSAHYAADISKSLQKQGIRVESDLRREKITYKIREHSLQKIPYILVVGEKERDSQSVAVRARGGVDHGVMPFEAFTELLGEDISLRRDVIAPA